MKCKIMFLKWNPVNTDTKGICQSVRIIRVSVLSGLSEKNVTDPCSLCTDQAQECRGQKCSRCVKRKSSYRPHSISPREHQKPHWCSHSFYFKAYQPRIGVNRSGGLFTENTVCIFETFDGSRKHMDLLGMNNYRTLAIMLIVASRGRQRERSRQAMTAAKGQGSETFV